MKLSLSFLATELDQFRALGALPLDAVEGVIFNREDLASDRWSLVWDNLGVASKELGGSNVTFHFPVNDSDYTEDRFVLGRLKEALARANDLGLHGIVVHSNRVRPISHWSGMCVSEEQLKVVDALTSVLSGPATETWLALENMPVMDNHGIEIDPTFVYPPDFSVLDNTSVRIIWDICHYFNSIATIKMVTAGKQSKNFYPNFQNCDYFDFATLAKSIVHWHFSAFQGIPNPETGDTCAEGCLPWEGELPASLFEKAFFLMQDICPDSYCVFEVSEKDYQRRQQGRQILDWARQLLDTRKNIRGSNALCSGL